MLFIVDVEWIHFDQRNYLVLNPSVNIQFPVMQFLTSDPFCYGASRQLGIALKSPVSGGLE